MIVQAFWRAIKVEVAQAPYDTLQLKVLYPALDSDSQNPLAPLRVAQAQAPFPVVIFFSGVNCRLVMYEWLALKLAARGMVVILFNWLAENIPGNISFSPGVDFAAFSSDVYGTVPTSSALPLLLAELEQLQSESILAGTLNLNQIILGGHSAGGRLALENANPQLFSQIAGAFSYGAHSAAPSLLGYEPGHILPLPSFVPMLLIGGTQDGVIAKNSHNYGITQWSTPTTPIERTFIESISGGRDDSALVILAGANHFSISDRTDSTLRVTALDFPSLKPENEIRSVMAEVIGLFIDGIILKQSEASKQLKQLLAAKKSLIASAEFK